MKNLLLSSLILFTLSAYAQKPLIVDIVPQSTDKVTQQSYVVLIPQAKLKDVESNWNSYLSKDSKGSSSDSKGVHTQKNVLVKNISPERFEVYSRMNETGDGLHLAVWLTQDGRSLVSDSPDSALDLAAKKYVRDFSIDQYRQAVQLELKREQATQKKMEEELSDLIKVKERSIKTVNENDREEKRTESAIEVTKEDIDNTALDINDQKQMVKTTASDPNALKGAEKTLGNLESDKRDLQKDNKKKNEHLDELAKENRAQARNLNVNAQNLELKTAAIEVQKQLVRDVLAKLNNIK